MSIQHSIIYIMKLGAIQRSIILVHRYWTVSQINWRLKCKPMNSDTVVWKCYLGHTRMLWLHIGLTLYIPDFQKTSSWIQSLTNTVVKILDFFTFNILSFIISLWSYPTVLSLTSGNLLLLDKFSLYLVTVPILY